MTRNKALQILSLPASASIEDIRKRYRSLMLVVHPDAMGIGEKHFSVDATDVNLAYEYLMKHFDDVEADNTSTGNISRSQRRKKVQWDAPLNPNAYREREILHTVEDMDGNIIGEAVLDSGKFFWTADEEFSLFLKSLYQCARHIIREYDERIGRGHSREDDWSLLSQITYLLSQQYVDTEMVLSQYTEKLPDEEVYRIDAMLEMSGRTKPAKEEFLYPCALRNHRLYVCNAKNKELGYLSFKDDRLYYGIIPLFERKAAMVKIQVQGDSLKRIHGKPYLDVALYVRRNSEDQVQMVESINGKIERALTTQNV